MPDMTIRLMGIEDYDAVTALWNRTEGMGMNPHDDSRERIGLFLARNPGLCFVAEQDGAVIGAVLCGHDGRRAAIYHLAVDERFRGQNIGRKLVASCCRELHRAGILKVSIVAYTDNEIGNAFWESVGFKHDDQLTMRRAAVADQINL